MVHCRDDYQVIRDEPVLYKPRLLKPESCYRDSSVQMLDTLYGVSIITAANPFWFD